MRPKESFYFLGKKDEGCRHQIGKHRRSPNKFLPAVKRVQLFGEGSTSNLARGVYSHAAYPKNDKEACVAMDGGKALVAIDVPLAPKDDAILAPKDDAILAPKDDAILAPKDDILGRGPGGVPTIGEASKSPTLTHKTCNCDNERQNCEYVRCNCNDRRCSGNSGGCGGLKKPYQCKCRSVWNVMVSLLLLLLSSCSPTLAVLTTTATCSLPLPQQQYDALFDLYNTTDGPNWTWKDTAKFGAEWRFPSAGVVDTGIIDLTAPCSLPWQGLNCSTGSNSLSCDVTGIRLERYRLSGQLPTSLMLLTGLHFLNLNNNSISGSLPSALGQVPNLTQLVLDFNILTGSIPSSLEQLSHLQVLSVRNNCFHGPIPASLGNLSNLVELALSSNHLSHTIPSSLGQLSELQVLLLRTNFLSGPIPASLGNLSNLVQLALSSNHLNRTIPSSLGNMSSLIILSLFSNSISGSIPSSLGQLQNLHYFSVASNSLNGTVPSSLGQIPKLQYLFLLFNSLTGSIPSSLGELSELRYLYLYGNLLNGTIPNSLGQLSHVLILLLNLNSLSGSIPSSLGQLSKLFYLNLNYNNLTGSIPSSLGQLTRMVYLDLDANSLIGTIPTSLGNLSSVVALSLISNSLTGPIPSSLGQLPHLLYLYLYSNALSGAIPSSLGKLPRVIYLDVSYNSLSGSIPLSLGQLPHLLYLGLNSNFLTGSITSSLANVTTILFFIVGSNFLTGTISSHFTQLTTCVRFFVNSNHLSGQLQNLFSSSDTFPLLESLDLSDNGFTGSFPNVLFSFRSLRTLSSSSNCFHGALGGTNVTHRTKLVLLQNVAVHNDIGLTLPNSSLLETVNLDGLSSGASCQGLRLTALADLLFPPNPNPGYIASSFMTGPIPSSLWSLPQLTTLTLNGNGFVGSINLGSFSSSTSKLTSVSLAYNRLTGSIPTALQLYGRFQYLDLSYNRLSGTLDPGFNFIVTDSKTLNISVNRLSGDIPTANTNLLSAASSGLIDTVLTGNLFLFKMSEVDTSIASTAVLYNGSYELDLAIYISSAFVTLWVVVGIFSSLISAGFIPVNNIWVKKCDSLILWWTASGQDPSRRECLQLNRTWALFRGILIQHLLMVGVAALLGFGMLPLKLSPSLQPTYSLYAQQYGWTWSVVYIKGTAPTAFVLLSVLLAVGIHYRKYFPIGPKDIVQSSTLPGRFSFSVERSYKLARLVTVAASIVLVNIAVILIINVVYITALNSAYIAIIQAAVAALKFVWTWGFLSIIRAFASHNVGTYFASWQVVMRMQVLVFNYIVAPCLATAVKDPSCFYELFNQRNALGSTTASFACADRFIFYKDKIQLTCDGSKNSTGIKSGFSSTQQLAAPFDPPFIYNYQCGSAVITNYVPVLLYTFVLAGLISPGLTLFAISYPEFVRRTVPLWIRRRLFWPALLLGDEDSSFGTETVMPAGMAIPAHTSNVAAIPTDTAIDPAGTARPTESLDRSNNNVSKKPNPVPSYVPVCKPSVVADHLALGTLIMTTFGLSTPYLAIVILCSALSQITVFQLLIGRYLHVAQYACVDSDGLVNKQFFEHSRWKVEEALRGAWEEPYGTANIVVIVVVVFWGLVIFDLVGDVHGYSVALTVTVAWMLCAPLVVHWAARGHLLLMAMQRNRVDERVHASESEQVNRDVKWDVKMDREEKAAREGHLLSGLFVALITDDESKY